MFKHTKAFCSFSVNDIHKAKQFYSEVLGINVKDNPMGVMELHFEGRNNVLIYPKPDHEPATFTVLNFRVKDINEAVDELIEKGVQFEQYGGEITTDEKGIHRSTNSDKGPNIAWFRDPAGNILSVLEEK